MRERVRRNEEVEVRDKARKGLGGHSRPVKSQTRCCAAQSPRASHSPDHACQGDPAWQGPSQRSHLLRTQEQSTCESA